MCSSGGLTKDGGKMPIWDFKCPKCGYCEWDKFFANWRRAEKLQFCPECGAIMERLPPTGGLVRFRHGGVANFWFTKHSDPDSEKVGHSY